MLARIPFVDLYPQYEELKIAIDAALCETLKTSSFTGGKLVFEFEAALAESVGTRFACGVAITTSAPWMTLKALKVGPGAEVSRLP